MLGKIPEKFMLKMGGVCLWSRLSILGFKHNLFRFSGIYLKPSTYKISRILA